MDMQPGAESTDEPGGLAPGLLCRVARLLSIAGAIMVLALVLLIDADIGSRFFFNRPLNGVAELVELTIVALVFLQLPMAVADGGMVRSGELLRVLSARVPRLGQGLTVLFELAGVIVLGVLAAGLLPKLAEAWTDSLYKGQPGMFTAPIWPVTAICLIGCALGVAIYAGSAVRRLIRAPEGR
ncbi:TRAP transporter small permease subunit [Frigidibacter sp.]|uniref:TRAP transporter small permease subunit n=1 Tax=Frigidibacter sp. TaxID=2586418 RepID=UPI002732AA3E|nr:TRAP transporter small permease [Frigidibacter sp.]MDP3342216.1 TRAP transporter small permease [Frigidibacter sp.]